MQNYSGASPGASSGGATPPRPPMQNTPDFSNTGTSNGNSTQNSASGATSSARDPVAQVKKTLSKAASQVGDKVSSGLDMRKDKAAAGLGSVAQALRQSSEQLRVESADDAIPGYVASAATQVERLSGYLERTDAKAIVGNVEDFARRQPALFIGGAFFLGVLGARFLKSSGESSASRSVDRNSTGGE